MKTSQVKDLKKSKLTLDKKMVNSLTQRLDHMVPDERGMTSEK